MTDIDLAAYLGRTGAAEETPSLAALTRLLHAHVTTFPFDTIDVLLGQHRGVDLDTVRAKFLDHHRGGYCFEHATLFHAVLLALGYDEEQARAYLAKAVEIYPTGTERKCWHEAYMTALNDTRCDECGSNPGSHSPICSQAPEQQDRAAS